MENYIVGDVRRITFDCIRKGIHFFDLVVDCSAENEFGGIYRLRFRFDDTEEKECDDLARNLYEQSDRLIGKRVQIECVAIDTYNPNVLTPSRYTPINIVDGGKKRVHRISGLTRTAKKQKSAEDDCTMMC